MANSVNYIEVLKALRDEEATDVRTFCNMPDPDRSAHHDKNVEALTAVIAWLIGESVEADTERLSELINDLDMNEMEYIDALERGILAIRAVPKITQENERLREALSNIVYCEDVVASARDVARAALRGEGANNER